jgi:hypothetical protein
LIEQVLGELVRLYEQWGRDEDAALWRERREARIAGQ